MASYWAAAGLRVSCLLGVVKKIEEDVFGDHPDAEGACGSGFP
jgi:hypothetical protein